MSNKPPDEPEVIDPLLGREAQAFPTLTEAQIARAARFGTERELVAGEHLFREGDASLPFYVILEGAVEVFHKAGTKESLITVHLAGSFTGEVNLLADRRSLVSGRVREKTRVLAIDPSKLRALVQTDSGLSEIIMRAFILRRVGLLASHFGDVVLIGSQHNAGTLRLQEFLTRNGHPYRYLDVDLDPSVQALLDGFHVGVSDVPMLLCEGDQILKNPSNVEVAECLGLNAAFDPVAMHDVVIVGAGPAGLAAAVYGASEGLDVLVLESDAPGGQAGSSSKIENYLGFPTGISGQALAGRALTQAEKFGARMVVAKTAVRLHCDSLPYMIELANGDKIPARSIIIATGAEYRKLEVPDLNRFEGVGIYYGATFVEAQRCNTDEVIVVGGGNSAGQAAMYLSQTSRHVHILIRGPSLVESMSRYLIRRIEDAPNITLNAHTELTAVRGDDHLESVTWIDRKSGKSTDHPIRHVFSMAGAKPKTDWLRGCVCLDEKGFILTGRDVKRSTTEGARGPKPMDRDPYLLETSLRGVFAVGDVRATSVKRVASAVGEGSVCILLVHKVLAE